MILCTRCAHKRRRVFRAMVIDFQDHYIIYIVLILAMLSCCRCFVEMCGTCMQGVDRCVDGACCDMREACGVADASVCALMLRRTVLLFCFGQPLLLWAVRVIAQSEHMQFHPQVWLLQLDTSAPRVAGAVGNSTLSTVRLGIVEIDYLLLAVVFGLTNSFNVLFFASWSKSLDGGTPWDCDVSESTAWFNFEVSYYVQVLCMNWMLLALVCREQTLLHVYYVGLALALIIWFFLAASRFPNDTKLEHYGATVAFGVLLLTLLPLWENMTTTCSVSIAACAVHVVCVLALVMGHYTAFGQASAAYICLVRFGVTVLCGIFNMVVVALDDGLCAQSVVAI